MRLETSVIAHPSAHVSLVQRATPEPIRQHFDPAPLRILCGDRDAQARSWRLHVPKHLDRAPEILADALRASSSPSPAYTRARPHAPSLSAHGHTVRSRHAAIAEQIG